MNQKERNREWTPMDANAGKQFPVHECCGFQMQIFEHCGAMPQPL